LSPHLDKIKASREDEARKRRRRRRAEKENEINRSTYGISKRGLHEVRR